MACLVFVSLAFFPGPLQFQGTHNSVSFNHRSSKLFTRDQPRLKRLIRWGREFLAETEASRRKTPDWNETQSEYFLLDWKSGKLLPFASPLLGKPIRLDISPKGRKAILLQHGRIFSIAFEEDGIWKSEILDFELQEAEPFLFSVGEFSACLIFQNSVVVARPYGKWVRKKIQGSDPISPYTWNPKIENLCTANRWINFGKEIWLSYNHGEFDGGIVSLNLNLGLWRVLPTPKYRETVNDICLGSDGFVWVCTGVAHLSLDHGDLCILSPQKPDHFLQEETGKSFQIQSSLSGDSVSSIDWDVKETPYVLTGAEGVLRYSTNLGWQCLTPGWPGYQHIQSLLVMPKGDGALIGSYDAGVLYWNWESGRIRRFTFAN